MTYLVPTNIDVVSVMAVYFDLLFVCTHAQKVEIYSHNTENINIGTTVPDKSF